MSDDKNNKKLVTIQESINVLSKHVVAEIFRLVESQKEIMGQTATDSVYMSVLASFVGTLVFNVLTAPQDQKKSKKDIANDITKYYGNLKISVQEAISAGFTGAMNKFTNKNLEYYCKIVPVPEPKNTKPC